MAIGWRGDGAGAGASNGVGFATARSRQLAVGTLRYGVSLATPRSRLLAEAARSPGLLRAAAGEAIHHCRSDFPKDGYDTGSISLHFDAVLDAFDARDCTLVTHDVGAWVGYACASRRPEHVKRLVLIDAAIPGLASQEAFRFSPETARKVWHFYFNYVPELPELLVVGREREFLTWSFRTKSADWSAAFDKVSLDIYVNAYSAPGRWSGGMGYYRSIFESMEQNRATASTRLTMPVLAIGGSASLGEAMAMSAGQVAENVHAAVIDACGHYVPEERPDELLAVLLLFSLD